MAVIAATSLKTSGVMTITETTLTAADSLVYNESKRPVLTLRNTTASPVVVTIDGSTVTTVAIPGTAETFDAASGKAITVPANGHQAVKLYDIREFLKGTVAVTGGTGCVAVLLEN